jgi:HEAT repeat protein
MTKSKPLLFIDGYRSALENYVVEGVVPAIRAGAKQYRVSWRAHPLFDMCRYSDLEKPARFADVLDFPALPDKEMKALAKSEKGGKEFFVNTDGTAIWDDDGWQCVFDAGPYIEAGEWLKMMIDDTCRTVEAALRKRFPKISLELCGHDGLYPLSFDRYAESIEDLREERGYSVDDKVVERFVHLFAKSPDKRWLGIFKPKKINKSDTRMVKLLRELESDDENDSHSASCDLIKLGAKVIPEVRARLTHKNAHTREFAYQCLGGGLTGDDEALLDTIAPNERAAFAKEIIAGLADKESGVRAYAAQALGHVDHPSVVAPLIKALGSRDGDVRLQAAMSLGRRKVREAIPRLAKMLAKDPSAGVRSYAPKALAMFGPETIGAILTGLDDKVSYVRRDSAVALGELKALEAVPKLVRALKVRKDDDDFSSAIDALAEIGTPEGFAAIIAFVSAPKSPWQMVRHGIDALGRKKHKEAIDPLIALLDDDRVSEFAADGLSAITKQKLGQNPAKWKAWRKKDEMIKR